MNKIIALVAAFSILSGCGADRLDASDESGVVDGSAPAGSSIAVYDSSGDLVATGLADSSGSYSVVIDGYAPTTFWLESGGGEVEKLNGDSIALSRTSGFKGVVAYAANTQNTVHLDYPNTIAAALAEYRAKMGVDLGVASEKSIDAISEWVGYDIQLYSGNSLHSMSVSSMSLGDIEAVLLNEAIIGLCESMEDADSLAQGACTITKVADMNYGDVSLDGLLNGVSVTGDVVIGDNAIDEYFARHQTSVGLLKEAEKNSELVGVDPIKLAEMADSINNMDIDIFSGVDTPDVPRDAPYLSVEGLDVSAKGDHSIEIKAFDYIGVKYLGVAIDGVEELINPLSEVHLVDTTTITNGVHSVEITATNYVGDKTVVAGELNIENKYDVITSMAAGDNLVSGIVELSAEINNDQGIEEIRFVIDSAVVGVISSESVDGNYTVEFDTVGMTDGQHTYQIEVTTSKANTYFRDIYFYVDNTPPVLEWSVAEEIDDPAVYPSLPVFDRVQQIEFEVYDQSPVTSIQFYWNDALLKSFIPEGDNIDGTMTYLLSIVIDTRTIYEGVHSLVMEVTDSTGNKEVQTRSVIIDWNDPLLKITTPSGAYFAGSKEITFQASDTNGFGDSEIKVTKVYEIPLVDGDYSNIIEVEEELNVGAMAKQGVFTVTPEDGEGGVRRLDVEIYDLAGKSATASVLLNYANVDPIVSFTRNDSGNHTTYDIEVYDPFNDDEIESLEWSCTDTRYDVYIESEAPKNLNKTAIFTTNKYRTDYNSCDGFKSIKKYYFSCTATATNSLGLTATTTSDMYRQEDCR